MFFLGIAIIPVLTWTFLFRFDFIPCLSFQNQISDRLSFWALSHPPNFSCLFPSLSPTFLSIGNLSIGNKSKLILFFFFSGYIGLLRTLFTMLLPAILFFVAPLATEIAFSLEPCLLLITLAIAIAITIAIPFAIAFIQLRTITFLVSPLSTMMALALETACKQCSFICFFILSIRHLLYSSLLAIQIIRSFQIILQIFHCQVLSNLLLSSQYYIIIVLWQTSQCLFQKFIFFHFTSRFHILCLDSLQLGQVLNRIHLPILQVASIKL